MVCKYCGKDKPLTKEFFSTNKQMKTGYLSRCISCQNILRNSKKKKYVYYYELENDGLKSDKIKASSKKNAKRILRFRYPNAEINKLYTNLRMCNNSKVMTGGIQCLTILDR